MTRSLDEIFDELRDEPPDRRLGALEHRVWRAIRQRGRSLGFMHDILAKVTVVAGAIIFGAAVGGVTASTAVALTSEIAVFSVHTPLAPSTILDADT